MRLELEDAMLDWPRLNIRCGVMKIVAQDDENQVPL